MHITALCPFCRSAYQVQATLRGQLVRCPNAACRKIFPVPTDVPPTETPAAPAPPRTNPPGNGQRSGSVGEMVPMLPAEQAAPPVPSGDSSKHVSEMVPVVPSEPAAPARGNQPGDGDWWQAAPPVRGTSSQPAAPASPPPPPPPGAWWRDAPPPVRNPQAPAESPAPAAPTQRARPSRSPQPAAETRQRLRPIAPAATETQRLPAGAAQTAQPRELPPGAWEPPPVRRGAGSDTGIQAPPETPEPTTHRPRVSKRGACVVIAALFLLTGSVLGGLSIWVWMKYHGSEEARLAAARADYEQGSYSSASSKYRELAQKFPDSPQAAEYRFLADWSAVCSVVSDPDADPSAAIARLEPFLKDHKKDPLMGQYAGDAGRQLLKLVQTFAARSAKPADDQPLKVADQIDRLRGMVIALGSAALSREQSGQISADLAKVRHAVEQASKRRDVLARLQQQGKETPMDAITRGRRLLAQMEREVPGIGEDPEAQASLAQLYEKHAASVVYHPEKQDGRPAAPGVSEDDARSVLFESLLGSAAPGKAPPDDPVVLALVRGVLYVLKQSNGELKWATRVGIDTTVLPVRVPASPGNPELFLVLSADTQTLSALGADSAALWEYPVGQRVLGRPVIIGHRAYLPAYDGWVHEIELSGGKLLGRYYLGQRLTHGGAREGDTSRIYFPADDSCVYVLDVEAKRCLTILYDGHPSGSLRSEPVIVPPEGNNAPGYLILNQTSGLDSMELRVFELPLQDRHAAPLTLKPPARLAGWTWFEPKQDGEKLAVLSDAGILGLFGIRQLGNRDQALFPLLQPGGLDLVPFLQGERELPSERGRAQVVHMQGNDLWVLAHGRLQQVRLSWKWDVGLQAKPGWKRPLRLGSPLHEPQRVDDVATGRSTFVLVTQDLEQETCLASRVDEEGHILWQRQLGLVCQGEPLALTPPSGGPPLLLALDQGGGLFVLDPPQAAEKSRPRWYPLPDAAALEANPLVPPCLLLAADGRSVYEVAAPGDGRRLILRHIEWVNGERKLRVRESQASMRSLVDNSVLVPAGSPAIVGSHLLVPTTDGKLMRLSLLQDQPSPQGGPSWRDRLAPVTASCHVLALGGDRFLMTDGGRGLSVYEWPPANGNWRQLPRQGDPLKLLEHLVAAPPVLLPSVNDRPRIAVADSAGFLRLFTVAGDGSLQPGPIWELKGKLTSGPFVHTPPQGGPRLGCVLDGRQLVWIDPTKEEPLWTHTSDSGAIIGRPQQVEDLLIVAHQSGHYAGLDPSTGQPKGPGYTLRTSAAPAATPVPFGAGILFTPLSDGTALLLAVESLRQPVKK